MFTSKRQIDTFVQRLSKQCLAHAKERGWIDDKFTLSIRIDTSARRTRSWGGVKYSGPFVSLAVNRYLNTQNAVFHEYRSFQHDPMIGTVRGSAEKALAATFVHELSHCLQFSVKAGSFDQSITSDERGHGLLWKEIYRKLRQQFVNNMEFTATESVVTATTPVVRTAPTISRADLYAKFYVYLPSIKAGRTTVYKVAQHLAATFNLNPKTVTTYCYGFKRELGL